MICGEFYQHTRKEGKVEAINTIGGRVLGLTGRQRADRPSNPNPRGIPGIRCFPR
jgi:hypothetical protein